MKMLTVDTQLFALAQSIRFKQAAHNLKRAELALRISEDQWKKFYLYDAQLKTYDTDWRTAKAYTKEELQEKATNHQRRAIEFWEKYNHFKNQ